MPTVGLKLLDTLYDKLNKSPVIREVHHMQWKEKGVVIDTRKYGNSKVVLSVFTRNRGVCKGLARVSKKTPLQIGDHVEVTWRARLEQHLGHFTYEVESSALYLHFHDGAKLTCLHSIVSIISKALAENDPHPGLYDSFIDFINTVEHKSDWRSKYLELELELLSQLGFALDLSKCAVSNTEEDLAFISPKTGRTVSRAVGMKYKDKLLRLPEVLRNASQKVQNSHCSPEEFVLGLEVLGFFLRTNVFPDDNTFLKSREFMIDLLSRT